MDNTGARWSVSGAEALLKLRAVRANDDFDDYWKFHLSNERHRVHELRRRDTTDGRLTSLHGSRTHQKPS